MCDGCSVIDVVRALYNQNRRMNEEHIAYILKETARVSKFSLHKSTQQFLAKLSIIINYPHISLNQARSASDKLLKTYCIYYYNYEQFIKIKRKYSPIKCCCLKKK